MLKSSDGTVGLRRRNELTIPCPHGRYLLGQEAIRRRTILQPTRTGTERNPTGISALG
jgi:hypothetical protein